MGATMTDEMIDLARRAVACKGWRWMPGMLTDFGERVTHPDICYIGTLPDLTDFATIGCLLALVRDPWGCPVWCSLDVEPDPLNDDEYVPTVHVWWSVWRAPDGDYVQSCGSGPTEAAALVAALEAAP